jgi:hypothetical protein
MLGLGLWLTGGLQSAPAGNMLRGSASGAGWAAGGLVLGRPVSGAAAALATAAGSLAGSGGLGGTAGALCGAAGSILIDAILAGNASGAAAVAGALTRLATLTGAASPLAAGTGILSRAVAVSGIAGGAAATAGALTVSANQAPTGQNQALAYDVLAGTTFRGTAGAVATAGGALSVTTGGATGAAFQGDGKNLSYGPTHTFSSTANPGLTALPADFPNGERIVVMLLDQGSSALPSSVAIGGIAATQRGTAFNGAGYYITVWDAVMASASNGGSVVVTHGVSSNNMSVQAYSVGTRSFVGQATATPPINAQTCAPSIDTSAGDVVLAAIHSTGNSGDETDAWTGATETVNIHITASGRGTQGAMNGSAPAGTPHVVSMAGTNFNTNPGLVGILVSYR